jgi:aldehyde reductase
MGAICSSSKQGPRPDNKIAISEISSVSTPTVKLSNGVDFPVVGLGTLFLTNEATFIDLLRSAFDAGYRHIDTAHYYNNHKLIGKALKQIFSEGKYKRNDIFITTKLFSLK